MSVVYNFVSVSLVAFFQDRKTSVHCAEWPSGQGGRESSNKQVQRSDSALENSWTELNLFLFVLSQLFVFCFQSDLSVGLGSGKLHSLPLSSVYTWGSGISAPLRLPMLNTEVLQVSLGRTQKMGVTKSGRLITWEVGADATQCLLRWSHGFMDSPFFSFQVLKSVTLNLCSENQPVIFTNFL